MLVESALARSTHEAVIRPLSATPVVAIAVGLVLLAIVCVVLASYLLYWRSGKR